MIKTMKKWEKVYLIKSMRLNHKLLKKIQKSKNRNWLRMKKWSFGKRDSMKQEIRCSISSSFLFSLRWVWSLSFGCGLIILKKIQELLQNHLHQYLLWSVVSFAAFSSTLVKKMSLKLHSKWWSTQRTILGSLNIGSLPFLVTFCKS